MSRGCSSEPRSWPIERYQGWIEIFHYFIRHWPENERLVRIWVTTDHIPFCRAAMLPSLYNGKVAICDDLEKRRLKLWSIMSIRKACACTNRRFLDSITQSDNVMPENVTIEVNWWMGKCFGLNHTGGKRWMDLYFGLNSCECRIWFKRNWRKVWTPK
jgi:hypothetical protein